MPSVSENAGQSSAAKAAQLPFEETLRKLEALVVAMESEDLSLEALLVKYEEGTRLVKACQDKLTKAEARIRQLEKTAAGEIKLQPLALPEDARE